MVTAQELHAQRIASCVDMCETFRKSIRYYTEEIEWCKQMIRDFGDEDGFNRSRRNRAERLRKREKECLREYTRHLAQLRKEVV